MEDLLDSFEGPKFNSKQDEKKLLIKYIKDKVNGHFELTSDEEDFIMSVNYYLIRNKGYYQMSVFEWEKKQDVHNIVVFSHNLKDPHHTGNIYLPAMKEQSLYKFINKKIIAISIMGDILIKNELFFDY